MFGIDERIKCLPREVRRWQTAIRRPEIQPDRVELVMTGLTRNGVWLVENGEIKYPVKNFRFTQSIIDALKETSFVGAETEMVSEFFFAASRVPGLKVDRFHFTGRSDH